MRELRPFLGCERALELEDVSLQIGELLRVDRGCLASRLLERREVGAQLLGLGEPLGREPLSLRAIDVRRTGSLDQLALALRVILRRATLRLGEPLDLRLEPRLLGLEPSLLGLERGDPPPRIGEERLAATALPTVRSMAAFISLRSRASVSRAASRSVVTFSISSARRAA